MISSVSSTQTLATTSSAQSEAALEKQVAAKEAEAKQVKDEAEATKLAAEIAALKAKLAALQAKQKSEQSSDTGAAARQAEFDEELLAEAGPGITI